MTDRVLVDRHRPNFEEGDDWSIPSTGAVSLYPSVPEDERRFTKDERFTKDDWITSHKITVTTCPEMQGIQAHPGLPGRARGSTRGRPHVPGDGGGGAGDYTATGVTNTVSAQ
jgi:hypothetical protein